MSLKLTEPDVAFDDTQPILCVIPPAHHNHAACSPPADSQSSETFVRETFITPPRRQNRLLAYLYISYFLSRWGERMWEFAVGLFMIEIWKRSLLLASLYGLVETASVVSVGVIIGEWVDRTPRLKVIQASLGVQNVSITLATVAILILLLHPGSMLGGHKTFAATLVALVNVLGGISALASLATKISLERDWVIVIAAESHSGSLTTMNAMMRRIDLSCKLLSAIFVGFIMSFLSVSASAILIAMWNTTCLGFEYWLLLTVYNETPGLHDKIRTYHKESNMEMQETVSEEDGMSVTEENVGHTHASYQEIVHLLRNNIVKVDQQTRSHWRRILHLPLFEGWIVYVRQEMLLAGVALSLLSVSVLSFGTLMTACLKWRGVPAYALGLARGLAALIGICGTLFYPILHAQLDTLKTGLWAVSLQWGFLSLCVVSVWLHSLTTSTALLMVGAAAARFGLWMFDLSVTQLMQETVPEVERGVVAGVQSSMQSLFQLLSFLVGMVTPHPQDFYKLIFMSFGSVSIAAVLYGIQVYSAQFTMGCVYQGFQNLR